MSRTATITFTEHELRALLDAVATTESVYDKAVQRMFPPPPEFADRQVALLDLSVRLEAALRESR